ncbi:pectate lyase family protein [Mongoliitalea daihaiensis]|uniref:pectate lyase family protein n=1 Tax=Mongoliitalea daihaiensis TaxID=2782006 RepID=UPI001F1E8251|nr:pectate lyase [Mongoliitalea daihaiensis]UJP64900.1 pectate lyase [Mongoliitalea daihaiensis]
MGQHQESQLAFPGAEGFGKYATGGRGGMVYIVTNLHDSGLGSLRWALEAKGPRTVIFEVSGTIELQSQLNVRNGNFTLAGQTAPGDGITIKNYPIDIRYADNFIIRYIRVRMGDEKLKEGDAINIRGGKNMIIDHCSFSWGTDETLSMYDAENATIQYSIIAEGLNDSVHEKGPHGYGSLIGGLNVSIYKNIFANFIQRMPQFTAMGKRGLVDMRNNLIFNWGFRGTEGGRESIVNIVSNYFKPGEATYKRGGARLTNFLFPLGDGELGNYGLFFLKDNILEGQNHVENNQWLGVLLPNSKQQELYLENLKHKNDQGEYIPFEIPEKLYPTELKSNRVLRELTLAAGNNLKRDAVDLRLIEQLNTGKATYQGSKTGISGIIDSQNDVGGWPVLQSLPAPLDTDRDGMPDAWEIAHGLDPFKRDHNKYDLDSDYTNLEVYLHSLVILGPKDPPTSP